MPLAAQSEGRKPDPNLSKRHIVFRLRKKRYAGFDRNWGHAHNQLDKKVPNQCSDNVFLGKPNFTMRIFVSATILLLGLGLFAQTNENKFRQLGQELPTPNTYRNGAGAPGHDYWQQKADYEMEIELDDEAQVIRGSQKVTYYNNSPDPLNYIWIQMDQNMRAKDSDTYSIQTSKIEPEMGFRNYKRLFHDFDGGFKLESVTGVDGKDLSVTLNKTMLRINLETPLAPGGSTSFSMKWWYNINDRMDIGGRSGYEYFEEDDNYLYTIAQFYPRLAVYSDVEGWQNKQFLGRGEFALTFGDFDVKITAPKDHVVAATGDLLNAEKMLSREQRKRLKEARTADKPVIIITQEEAEEAEKSKETKTKTWHFNAKNVRDFGFASSRKFIWDAMGVEQEGKTIMAMSYYPKEGNPLWEEYSTLAVAKTLEVYSKHTFPYPYPKAISVHAARIGMEYPMICFNFGRPKPDGTYSQRTRNGMISVIIHEIGHNYFPMIVNSDERQWTWMDEGLNTFLQYLTEQEFEPGYASRRGPAANIVDYMKGDKDRISPIMTNSESIWQFGSNAYGKPATALNILRKSVMGPELFDHAFKEYANRWMFKHPSPADFFRTMEDASAFDLDWFWRGWFYTNEHVDLAITDVKKYTLNYEAPTDASAAKTLKPSTGSPAEKFDLRGLVSERREEFLSSIGERDKELLARGANNFYELSFENVGGLVMPIFLTFDYADGTTEDVRIPAEIWRMGTSTKATKVFVREKEITKITLDKDLESADVDTSNNYWPSEEGAANRFEEFKNRSNSGGN